MRLISHYLTTCYAYSSEIQCLASVQQVDIYVQLDYTICPAQQLQCNACWAFAAASAVESKRAIERGTLLPLSRQQLVDCVDAAHGYPDDSCKGGFAEDAFKYIQAQGLASEAAYGNYTGQKSTCKNSLLSMLPAAQLVKLSAFWLQRRHARQCHSADAGRCRQRGREVGVKLL